MKILYHHRIASKDGQYVHLEEVTNALKELGHVVILVGPGIVENSGFGSDGGIVPFLKKHIPKFIYELLEFFYSFYDFFKLLRAIKKHQPDCIYERYNLFFVSGIWVKKLTKLPLLLEVNSPLFMEREKFGGIALHRLAMWSEKYVWCNADYTLPVSQVMAAIIQRETGKHNQVVIHNGIKPDNFKEPENTADFKQQLGFGGKFVLGFTGFVREWHRIEQVLDIIKENQDKNLVLLLVGDGPARITLENYAKELGIADCLIITGIISRNKMSEYVALFDVALQSAVTSYASPLKMFEYLAMGKLIVAPDEDNIKEILTHEQNGLLFDRNKPDAFKQMVVKAIELENKVVICQNAKDTIVQKKFTWIDNAKRVTKLFNILTS